MHMRAILGLALVFAGCNATAETDAGPLFDDDAGPPQFEVRIERSAGVELEDGDALEVHYGCQGGAHVFFDVVAIGSGLANARVRAELIDRSIELPMSPTDRGAELRYLMLVLADYLPGGHLAAPGDQLLRVTVVRADGARVAIGRMVHLVDGDECEVPPFCSYTDVPGTGHITALEPPPTAGCDEVVVGVTFDYTNDAGTSATSAVTTTSLPPDCFDAVGLAIGNDIPVVRQEIVPGTGSCSPTLYSLAIDRSPCDAICPVP